MLDQGGHVTCRDGSTGLSSTGSSSTGSSSAERAARRRLLKAAVFPPADGPDQIPAADRAAAQSRVLAGTVLDASPHVLTILRAGREERLALMPDTKAWRGGPADLTAVGAGDGVVVRLHPSRRGVAVRIWANIGRVTGVILERNREGVVVEAGEARGCQVIVIPRHAESRIQVRFPRLEPGYLIDVIGLRRGGIIEGLIPATSQPTYRADQMLRRSPIGGRPMARIGGSATWHEPAGEPDDAEGVFYSVLDQDMGCGEQLASRPGCVRMPYLSIGSLLEVRNECTGDSRVLPVTGCAAVTRLFSDRCVTCGTSPRGRVADLALASFVGLGGELERGCFNATIVTGP
jgi:hypothetical protein